VLQVGSRLLLYAKAVAPSRSVVTLAIRLYEEGPVVK